MKALLLAAMPVVLINGTTPNLDHWLQIESAIAAAVECRHALPLRVLEGIAQLDADTGTQLHGIRPASEADRAVHRPGC